MVRKGLLLMLLLSPCAARQDQTEWLNDLKQGMFEAKQTGKPLLVVFR